MIEITAERVRWFAAYHEAHPDWGVFHVALGDGNYECGASDMDDGGDYPADVIAAADWFDELTETDREKLSYRVRTLEAVRRQDAPAATPANMPSRTSMDQLAEPDARIAARLSESARRTFYALIEAVQAAGAPVTLAEAMQGRTRNGNVFRTRSTELYYIGALRRCDLRTCKISGRAALTWMPLAPPWTPIPGGRTNASTLRPLLLEAAALLLEESNHADHRGDYDRCAQLRAAAAEYQTTAANVYTKSEIKER